MRACQAYGPFSDTALLPAGRFTSIATLSGRVVLNLGGICLTMFFAEIAALTPVYPALRCFTILARVSGVSYILLMCIGLYCPPRAHGVVASLGTVRIPGNRAIVCKTRRYPRVASVRKYTCVPVSSARMPACTPNKTQQGTGQPYLMISIYTTNGIVSLACH